MNPLTHFGIKKQFIKDRVNMLDKKQTYKVYRMIEVLEGDTEYCPKCSSKYYTKKKSFGGASFMQCKNCGYQTKYKYPKRKQYESYYGLNE